MLIDLVVSLWWYIAQFRSPPRKLNSFCVFTTAQYRAKIWPIKLIEAPPPPPPPGGFGWCPFYGCGPAVVYHLVIVVSIVVLLREFCVESLYCCAIFCVLSSFAIIPLGKRELAACILLSSGCYVAVIVLCFFLTVPWFVLWCVIVAFPGHTRLPFQRVLILGSKWFGMARRN